VHCDDLGGCRSNRHQPAFHRISTRRATWNDAREFPQALLRRQRKKGRRLLRGQNYDHFLNAFAQLERLQSVKDYWTSCKLEKLFWPIACHPGPGSGGGNDRDVHEDG
jgi:hypothetical protein